MIDYLEALLQPSNRTLVVIVYIVLASVIALTTFHLLRKNGDGIALSLFYAVLFGLTLGGGALAVTKRGIKEDKEARRKRAARKSGSLTDEY